MELLGIDLGTTNSLCAVFRDGEPRLVRNAAGSELTPSVVGILDTGEVLVGQAARDLAITQPDRTAARFKRWMGTDHCLEVAGKEFSAQELSSLVLRSLKEDAAAELGHEVTAAVITVPAYFNELQREATRAAAELAGLDVRRIVNEPTAAALAYGQLDAEGDRKVLVFDLGGGTFDVTLLEIFEGTLEIVATAGHNRVGGEDFTERLVDLVLKREDLMLETEEFRHPTRVARLREECERAKRELGQAATAEIRLPDDDGRINDDAVVHRITAAEFEIAAERLLEMLREPIERVLRDGSTPADAVDEILLVGGATRMPLVQRLIEQHFGRAARGEVDPDRVVARGAAVQAALIIDDRSVDDLVMTDVCPFTLGVAISKHVGNRVRDGYYLPIIHRNTTVPVSKEEIVSTMYENQREVEVRVHQGESRRADDNLLLGTLRVTDVPEGDAGRPIGIRFTYDQNGMLEVEAVIEETGQRFATVFTHNSTTLSPEQIARAHRTMKELKFYPRDELENRRLLLFAEAAVGRVAHVHRDELEEVVDAYESALHGSDRDGFSAARDALLFKLSVLGELFGEDPVDG